MRGRSAVRSPGSRADRPDRTRSRRLWQVGSVVVCLAGGLLIGTTRAYSQGEDIRNRSVDLASVIRDAEGRVAAAADRAEILQQQIDAAAGLDVSPQVARARADAVRAEPAAGLTAVTGPGLTVTLSDAPRDSDGNYPVGVQPDDLVVHQQDVQSVVNALWAGGAEAMTIMGQRVVTTSAVRCIGNTLLLQGRTYSPPFVITGIGEPTRMENALQQDPGVVLFREYVDRFGLTYLTRATESVTLPAYDGLLRLSSAHGIPR